MGDLHGNLSEYLESESIENYLERFEMFMAINGITDDSEKVNYLTVYGGTFLYEKIKVSAHPESVIKTKYSEMKPKLVGILKKKKVYHIERAKFYNRVQKRGESVSEFGFALKKIASECNFGTYLNITLRDRFLYNLENEYVKTMTIKAEKASFEDTVAEALLHETNASANSHKMSENIDKFALNGRKFKQKC